MNTVHTVSRVWTLQNLPFRSIPTKALRPSQPQRQLRYLSSSTTTLQAQPIDLTSAEAPAPKSESSNLTPDILSRAPTDSYPPSSDLEPEPETKPLSTTSPFLLLGTVTRTGTMAHTIQITRQTQILDRFLQKHYTRPTRLLAHDPHPSGFLREGDVVEYGLFSEAERHTKEEKRVTLERNLIKKGVIRLRTRKGRLRNLREVGVQRSGPRWVVRRVVSPFGLSEEERLAEVERKSAEVVEEVVKIDGKRGSRKQQQQQKSQQQQQRRVAA